MGASEMTAHALLLTGVPGVGKTTIVSKVAAGLSGRRSRGFVTDEIREGGRRVGFEIRTFGGKTRTLAGSQMKTHKSPMGGGRRVHGTYRVRLCPVLEQLCGVQLVPQTIGYRESSITRSETSSSRQKTPIAASVAAPGDTRHC